MLGGSSSLNVVQYVRGHPYDYNHWEDHGNTGWNYENVLNYFKKSEGNQNESLVAYKNGRYHNANGPMKVSAFGGIDPMSYVFRDAGMEQGIPSIPEINADKHVGYTFMQGNMYKGLRQSTANSYLSPAKNRKNLHIIKHALVSQIIIDKNNRAIGVKFIYKGKHKMKAYASKEVILSAGSIMSPPVLMLSGIGPKRLLQKHRIRVKSDLAVGENLHDHIQTNTWFSFSPAKTTPPTTSDAENLNELLTHQTGPLSTIGFNQLAGFINLTGDRNIPEIQPTGSHYPMNDPNLEKAVANYQPEIRQKLLDENKTRDLVILYLCILRPKSRGTVRINSTSIYDKPIIRPNTFGNRKDLELMLQAVKQQKSYVSTKAFRKRDGEFVNIPIKACTRFGYDTDDYLRCYIQHMCDSNYHPVGTSKMGPDSDPRAVVDPRLRVRNIKRLRQIDAGM